jgi:hypothetical protein
LASTSIFIHKVNVKLLINYAPCHEDAWRSEGIAPPFVASLIDGREWSAPRPGGLISREIPHCTGGWVGPTASLDAVEKKKFSGIEHRQLGQQPFTD